MVEYGNVNSVQICKVPGGSNRAQGVTKITKFICTFARVM